MRIQKKPFRQRASSQLMSFGALLFSSALVVGMSIPANAFFVEVPEAPAMASSATQLPDQRLAVLASTSSNVQRDTWGVLSYAEMLQLKYGSKDYKYDVNNDGAIRWPFPYAAPISSGFGDRAAPCRGCSSQHMGVDFTPGRGAPIYAIADGVVSLKEQPRWGFGNHVYVEHIIGGQLVTSVYAHMQTGSSALQVGDQVKAGDLVGLVGSTGTATGPHLHLEIRVGDVQVDPFAWLRANAG